MNMVAKEIDKNKVEGRLNEKERKSEEGERETIKGERRHALTTKKI